MILKRLGVLSCAKISGILYAALGLIVGFFASFFSLVMGSMMSEMGRGGGMFGALFGVGAIIILPIFYGVIGFVGGAISAWLYNIIAGSAGGIEMEFESEVPGGPPNMMASPGN